MGTKWAVLPLSLATAGVAVVAALAAALGGGPVLIDVPGGPELRILTRGDVAAGSVAADEEGWTGGSRWESGEILSQLLLSQPDLVEGRRVIELGAGCGAVGLTAAALGAQETHLTDRVPAMAELNLANALAAEPALPADSGLRRARVVVLTWGSAADVEPLGPPMDLVLGADLLNVHDAHEPLAETIDALSGPGTRVLLVSPTRGAAARWLGDPGSELPFFARMRRLGFSIADISAEEEVADAIQAGSSLQAGLIRAALSHFCRFVDCPLAVLDRVGAPRVLRLERGERTRARQKSDDDDPPPCPCEEEWMCRPLSPQPPAAQDEVVAFSVGGDHPYPYSQHNSGMYGANGSEWVHFNW